MRVTPQESEQVQRCCFEMGIYWKENIDGVIQLTGKPHLYIDDCITFTGYDHEEYFSSSPNEEITPQEFLRKYSKNTREVINDETRIKQLQRKVRKLKKKIEGKNEEISDLKILSDILSVHIERARFCQEENNFLLDSITRLGETTSDNVVREIVQNIRERHRLDKMLHDKKLFKS